MEKKLAERLATLPRKKLCFVIFGNDPASLQFVKMKSRVAERLGISVTVLEKNENISTDEAVAIIQEISDINHAEKYDGVVIQLPLPASLDTEKILNSLPEKLDIDMLGEKAREKYAETGGQMENEVKSLTDAISAENGHGRQATSASGRIPPVARAVKKIFDFYEVSLSDKKIVIVGNGRLVGEPLSEMFKLEKIPFEIINKNTDEKERFAKIASADVIISGVGFPHLIKPEMVKSGVILIDAGTSEQDGKLVGDIDPQCATKASLLSPVPGGVGPVTVMSLFENL